MNSWKRRKQGMRRELNIHETVIVALYVTVSFIFPFSDGKTNKLIIIFMIKYDF